MRLFVQHADRTVVVALAEGATLTDLLHKCATKFDLTTPVTLQLDAPGTPVVEATNEVRDGDTIRVVLREGTDEHKSKKAKRTHGGGQDVTGISARDVSHLLRDRHELFHSFAGFEDGNALVRVLLAANGNITQEELSTPTDPVFSKEASVRKSIVATIARLSRWSAVGFHASVEEDDFLQAAAYYFRKSIIVMNAANNRYTIMRRYRQNDTDVVMWEGVLDEIPECLLISRKGGSFAAFCKMVRPMTREEAIDMHSTGFGACHDRSKYVVAAVNAGILPKGVRHRPRDSTHVPFIYAHMNLNGIARQTLNLLDLTFREECERRERCGELSPGACIPFEDTHAPASGIFVRRDVLPLRNEWSRSHAAIEKELDARQTVRASEGLMRRSA